MRARAAFVLLLAAVSAWAPRRHSPARPLQQKPDCADSPWDKCRTAGLSTLAALALFTGTLAPVQPALATDTAAIGKCVLTECQAPLAKCILNPKCFANLVCINTCNNRPDETECQIKCGDLFENDVAGEFNSCAVSQKKCVPRREDDGAYPIPPQESIVKSFDPVAFDGKWYISAGLNPIFDIFDCQVHFFTGTAPEAGGEPGRLYGKLNWRINAPDGEFFDKQAIQTFIQDPKQPGVLYNHDNEYLHYQDDWYILDYGYMNDAQKGYVVVYYRGTNDAWDGYGGAVVYTRATKIDPSVKPSIVEACKRAGLDYEKQFKECDNTCRTENKGEVVALRERYVGSIIKKTGAELETDLTVLRASTVSGLSAAPQAIGSAEKKLEKAEAKLAKQFTDFESQLAAEISKDLVAVEKEIVKDVVAVEKEIVKDVVAVEKEIEKDVLAEERALEGVFQGLFGKKPQTASP